MKDRRYLDGSYMTARDLSLCDRQPTHTSFSSAACLLLCHLSGKCPKRICLCGDRSSMYLLTFFMEGYHDVRAILEVYRDY